jgi:hypothetical protein
LTKNPDYNSFLFRFRRAMNDDQPIWIVSVQNTRTGQQQYFSSLDGLIQFLQNEFGSETMPVSIKNRTDPVEA